MNQDNARSRMQQLGKTDWEAIDAVIPANKRLLYVKPYDLSFLKHLVVDKKSDLVVLDNSIKNIEIYTRHNINAKQGNYEYDLRRFSHKEFDYLIMDMLLQASLDPVSVLQDATSIAHYVIVTIKNYGHIFRRLSFLMLGSLWNNNEKWHNGAAIRPCNIRECINFCIDNNILIERISCYGSNVKMFNFYDITRLPSLFADSALFILSDESAIMNNTNISTNT